MEKIEKFTKGKPFVFLAAIYYFLVWVTGWEVVGLSLALLAAAFLLIFFKDLSGVMTITALFITGVSLTQLPVTILPDEKFFNIGESIALPVGISALAVFFIAVIIHFIRFKIQKKALIQPMNIAFFCVFAAIIMSGVFSDNFSLLMTLIVLALYFVLFVLVNLAKAVQPNFNFTEYAALIALLIGVSAVLDTFIFYIKQEDLLLSLLSKRLEIGWGITNTIAPFMVIAVPMGMYLYIKNKNPAYLLLSLLCYIGTFLTVCRGEIFILLICTPFLLFFLFYYARKSWGEDYKKKKWEIVITLSVAVLLLAVCFIVFNDFLTSFFSRIFIPTDSGRGELRSRIIQSFKDFPLFGRGFSQEKTGWPLAIPEQGLILITPHSIHFKILSAMGIFGLAVFMFFYYHKYKIVFLYKSSYNTFVILSLIMFVAYAFADPTFYAVHIQMITFFLLEGARRDAKNAKKIVVWDKMKAVTFKNGLNTLITIIFGALIFICGIFLVLLYADGKYIFNEDVMYILTIFALCISTVVLVPAIEKIVGGLMDKFKVLSGKRKKQVEK